MSIKIVHAVSNKDQRPGDSSGDEITITSFYTNKNYPWNYLCICTDTAAAANACELAKQIALNNHYGYSQTDRLTGPKSIISDGVENGSGEFDCSSLQSFVYYCQGILPKYSYNTDSLLSALKASGKFIIIENPVDDSQARIGSLFLRPKHMADGHGHVMMAVNNGSNPYPLESTSTHTPVIEPDPIEPYILFKGSVNIREESNANAKKLGIAHKGDKLLYIGDDENGWHEVIYKGRQGFVTGTAKYQKYMEIVNI